MIDGPGGHFNDIGIVHGDGNGFWAQAFALAGRAGPVGHIFADLFADIFRVGLAVTSFQVADHAFESRIERGCASVPVVIMDADFFSPGSVQDDILLFRRQFLEGFVHINVEMLGSGFKQLAVIAGVFTEVIPLHHDQRPITKRFLRVDDAVGINFEFIAQPLAVGAGAVRGVE